MSSHPFSHDPKMLESMHRQYVKDPKSIDASWRYFFEGMNLVQEGTGQDLRIFHLIDGYRRFGHLKATNNPIAISQHLEPPELSLERFGFKQSDLQKSFPAFGKTATLESIIKQLETYYCGSFAVEYMDCHYELQKWIQERVEKEPTPLELELKQRIFHHLNRAEVLELFLHTKYVGQKRFSLEGAESLIAVLAELIEAGSVLGVNEIVMGMAHRGRLNVLANILKKSYAMLFSEFEDFDDPDWTGGDGDVKYHKGYSSTVKTQHGEMHISLAANPSHLESVDSVVQGKVFAKQIAKADEEKKQTMAVLVHGEAALAGQGIVYEILQMNRLQGYGTGGTIHLVIDNQIGFTTVAREYRSTRYSTDIARTFGCPVFHVNGEDPEACVRAAMLALEIRQKFHSDVFINMLCFRKYGHNEGDEPSFTQPKQYQIIRSKKSVREHYHDVLIEHGALEKIMAEKLEKEFQEELHYALEQIQLDKKRQPDEAFSGVWEAYHKTSKEEILASSKTGVSEKTLREIATSFSQIPDGFNLHPKLKRLVEDRLKRLDGKIDWALAEHLAFGSLLNEGSACAFQAKIVKEEHLRSAMPFGLIKKQLIVTIHSQI